MAALELSSALGGLNAHAYTGKLRTRARDQTLSSEHPEFGSFPGMTFGAMQMRRLPDSALAWLRASHRPGYVAVLSRAL